MVKDKRTNAYLIHLNNQELDIPVGGIKIIDKFI